MKPGGMSETTLLELVIADLHNHARLDGRPRQILVTGPPTDATRCSGFLAERALRLEVLKPTEDRISVGVRETRTMTYEVKLSLIVVEAEEERADLPSILVLSISPDDAVSGSPVLDLDHCPLAMCVRLIEWLGNDPIAPGGLEFIKPASSLLGVMCRWREVPGMLERRHHLFQASPPLTKWELAKILTIVGQQIERHQLCRGLFG